MDLVKELKEGLLAANRLRVAEIHGDPVLAVAAVAVNAAAEGLREDNDRAERRAGLDSHDVQADLQAEDEHIRANRFCATEFSYACRRSARITWAPDDMSFTSTAGDEQVARWAGYRLRNDIQVERENDNLDLVWHGTQRTASGTWAAQFEVFEYE